MAPLPPFAAVIVAAGQGLRAGGPVPKQFAAWRGKPLVRHSAETFARLGARPIVVAIPEGADELARDALAGIEGIRLIGGGATRQQAVRPALEALAGGEPALLGQLMADSQCGYDAMGLGHPAATAVVEDALGRPGVLGARSSGGGCGGTVVVVAERGALDDVDTLIR